MERFTNSRVILAQGSMLILLCIVPIFAYVKPKPNTITMISEIIYHAA